MFAWHSSVRVELSVLIEMRVESDCKKRTHLDDGARLLALLATLLRLALVRRDDGNTGELVRHDC